MTSVLGHESADVRGVHRGAAYTAFAWSAVLLAWAVYNAGWQVGVGDFLRGIFYYGVGDDTSRAETSNLNYAIVYIAASVLILRGSTWGRGMACGAALIEGYNRLRSLNGALFDSRQKDWFTHNTQGELKLATFAVGFLVTAVLVVLLVRGAPPEREPWTPPANPWTQMAQQATANPYQQQYQQPAAPAQAYQQPAAPAQPYQQAQPGYGYPAQQPPAPQQGVQPAAPQQQYAQPVPPQGAQPAPQQPQPPAGWQPPSPGQ
jgi:hypothetical protein